ncbi:hypothetical protein B0I35DRAFT_427188 [Stachybotrys elegans]|uniref:Uncharacterized protein n=1 Tax=Stachybotrys elegans TaxID=80388 RepID=A0A8K0T1Q7_9HYPO|nr:hypothetical protein B0I35DRAFT_427188 [Stachybotrys elegans]
MAADNLVIFYNDFIDSDNLAAALALARATNKRAATRVVWILEPRQVSLGLDMTPDQIARCKALLQKYFASRGNPFKLLLGGLLDQHDVDSISDIDAEERSLLQLAVKPAYGPKEDAQLHGNLMAWDFAECLAGWSYTSSTEVFVDLDTLEEIENPVNLNMHHHEELINRDEDELATYQRIMQQSYPQRVDSLRGWYRECIASKQKARNPHVSVQSLQFEKLCQDVAKATNVRFFGGSSLRILRKFIDAGVAPRIQCNIQAGSSDLSANLFPTQFNIALNKKAAKFVLGHHTEFKSFTIVPSQTAQSITYSVLGLQGNGGLRLGKRILGFNCRESPLAIASKNVTIEKNYSDKAYSMPDLTAFLCALVPGYMGCKTGFVEIMAQDETLLLHPSDSGIPIYDMGGSKSLSSSEASGLLWALQYGNPDAVAVG